MVLNIGRNPCFIIYLICESFSAVDALERFVVRVHKHDVALERVGGGEAFAAHLTHVRPEVGLLVLGQHGTMLKRLPTLSADVTLVS